MHIRRARPEDGWAMSDIYRPFVAKSWISLEMDPPDGPAMAKRIGSSGDSYPWLALTDDEHILGYAYANPHRSRAGYRTSVDTAIYLHAAARNRGWAMRLYMKLLQILIAQNRVMAFAGIVLPNPASLRLHQKLGYQSLARYPNVGYKLGAWRDTIWMSRELAPPCNPPKAIRLLSEIDFAALET